MKIQTQIERLIKLRDDFLEDDLSDLSSSSDDSETSDEEMRVLQCFRTHRPSSKSEEKWARARPSCDEI